MANASTIYYSSLNLAGPSATNTDSSVLPTLFNGATVIGGHTGLEVDSGSKLLASVRISTAATPPASATTLYLHDITDPNSPVTAASAPFPANNTNGNGSGRAAFATNVPGHPLVVFALATNSGLMAKSVTITSDVIPPTVTGPDARSVYVRGQTTLTTTVTGTPPFTYVWTRDGNPVPGAASASLILNPFTAADGAVYACSLTTDVSNVKVYRWADDAPATVPTVAYDGNAAGGRLGDNLDARGSGADTQIVLGSRNQNSFIILTGDPSAGPMTATNILTDAPVNSFGLSAAFGTGNTIWGKTNGNSLVLASFDPAAGTGTVLRSFGPAAGVPSSVNTVAVDSATGLLVALQVDNSDNTRLYKLPDPLLTGSLVLCDQEFFATDNANAQITGALSIRGGKVFSLSTGNGLVCYSTTRPAAPEFGLISRSDIDDTVTFRLRGTVGKTYLIEVSADLANGSWTSDGTVTLTLPEQPVTRSTAPGRNFFRARER